MPNDPVLMRKQPFLVSLDAKVLHWLCLEMTWKKVAFYDNYYKGTDGFDVNLISKSDFDELCQVMEIFLPNEELTGVRKPI